MANLHASTDLNGPLESHEILMFVSKKMKILQTLLSYPLLKQLVFEQWVVDQTEEYSQTREATALFVAF